MIILAYFSKDLTNNALTFHPFRRKTKFLGNFKKSFDNFQKSSLENCEKCIVLAYFSKNLTNHAFIFRKTLIVGKLLDNFDNF